MRFEHGVCRRNQAHVREANQTGQLQDTRAKVISQNVSRRIHLSISDIGLLLKKKHSLIDWLNMLQQNVIWVHDVILYAKFQGVAFYLSQKEVEFYSLTLHFSLNTNWRIIVLRLKR